MVLVTADNLANSYGSVRAVNGLSLKIDDGSISGLIGPNGAGKTTTIKMILGLLRPDGGRVQTFGQNPWDNPEIRKLMGVVYEKALFPSHQGTLGRDATEIRDSSRYDQPSTARYRRRNDVQPRSSGKELSPRSSSS